MPLNDNERLQLKSALLHAPALSPSKDLRKYFSETTKGQIKNLIKSFASTQAQQESRKHYLNGKPTSHIAAVLVLLFESEGHLRVLLTTRAKRLVHGGETCLPGGHMEEADGRDIEFTAHREAHEEVSLPLSSPHIHTLGILEPHSFRHLIVIPVVALLTDNSILHNLKRREKEVEHIFSHPLEAILDPPLAGSICGEYSHRSAADDRPQEERLVKHGSKHWPHESKYRHHQDYVIQALGGMTYRMQCFQTSASPITGMTADVLIDTAEIAYKRPLQYQRYASDQIREYDALMHRFEVEKKRVEDTSAGSRRGV